MWKLKCFKFFLKRLLDLERVLEQDGEPVTRVEVSGALVQGRDETEGSLGGR